MRLQALVNVKYVGVRQCDECHGYTQCYSIQVDGVLQDVFCTGCLSGHTIMVEKDVELSYGRKERKRTQKRAKKSEVKTAEETGGRCTGYFPSSGDSRNSRFFFEDKTRIGGDQKSYRLSQATVIKGRDQAVRAGLVPVFRIHLKDVSIGAMLWDDLVALVCESEDD